MSVYARLTELYDRIRDGCDAIRRPDPRLAAGIVPALADLHTVVDAGAGGGGHEPVGCVVVAVEPSTMAAQRPPGSAPVVCARAESPPFASEAARRAHGMHRAPALIALVGCLGLLVAGCGGGSGSSSVAHLGSTTTSGSNGGGSAALTAQQEIAIDVAYAACLSRNGVEVQAARTGGLVWAAGPGLPGPGSPQDAAAERDCKSLLPKGGLPSRPTAAQNARALAQLLRYAECSRAHGVPNFPDPTSMGLRFSPRGLLLDDGWDADAPWAPLSRDLAEPVEDSGMRIELIASERAPVRAAVQRAAFEGSTFTEERWQAMAAGLPQAASSTIVCAESSDVGAVATYKSAGFQPLPGVRDLRRSA